MTRYRRQPNGTRKVFERGSYGYWVGSLGSRASVSVVDRHESKVIDGEGGGVQRLFCAQDVEMAVMDGIADIVEEHATRMITPETLELVHEINPKGVRENYFAITGYSRGGASTLVELLLDGFWRRSRSNSVDAGGSFFRWAS